MHGNGTSKLMFESDVFLFFFESRISPEILQQCSSNLALEIKKQQNDTYVVAMLTSGVSDGPIRFRIARKIYTGACFLVLACLHSR